jgi:hypothetical protein
VKQSWACNDRNTIKPYVAPWNLVVFIHI